MNAVPLTRLLVILVFVGAGVACVVFNASDQAAYLFAAGIGAAANAAVVTAAEKVVTNGNGKPHTPTDAQP
jgi:hypothetical protein